MPRKLRSTRHKENLQESSEGESEEELDTTIMDNAEPPPQTGVTVEQMSAILASINALKLSVEGLRNSTIESQQDVERLRTQIHAVSRAPISSDHAIQPCDTPTSPPIDECQIVAQAEGTSYFKLYDLPQFSGNAEEWPLFLTNFKDTTANFRYNDRQNLMRLQKSLTGAAREAVASMLIFPNDVKKAMEELEFRFRRPDIMVRYQLQKVQQIPHISEGKLEQVVGYSTKVRNVVAFLISAGCQHHLSNPTLLDQLVTKLPANKQFDWAKHAASIKPFATVNDFSMWLCDLARIICLMPVSVLAATTPRSLTQHQPRRIMHLQEDGTKREVKCYQCGKGHMISDCQVYNQSLSIQDRWQKVKSAQLCFACLRKGHNSANCRLKQICGINDCRRRHHKSLHEEPNNNQGLSNSLSLTNHQPSENTTAQPILNCRSPQSSCSQLFKILPVTLFGPNGKTQIFAMFDDGSAITILEEEIANALGLKGRSQPLTLQWYNQGIKTETSRSVRLEISGDKEEIVYDLKNVRTIQGLSLPVQSFCKADHKHFECVPISDYVDVKPAMLIGLDNTHLGVATAIIQDKDFHPLAAKTKLGWVAYGPTATSASARQIVMHIQEEQKLNDLNKIVTEYFMHDSLGIDESSPILESLDNIKARDILKRTTKRIGDRFETGLIWKKFPPELPNNYELARSRLVGIEKRMIRDTKFGEKYKAEMAKYIEKGYARQLKENEIENKMDPIWYLPHFAVHNPHKPEKTRIVFDAAATVNTTSLNSELLKGPEQAKSLMTILFKFREGPVAVAADIREMFSQVKIRENDQHAQRFLWRHGDSNQTIQHYIMTSMVFGAVCSPCCAEYVKNINAEDYREDYPDAVAAIIEKHYVDDFVCSFRSEEEAQRVCKDVIFIHAKGGFELRNFVSNSNQLQNALNKNSLDKMYTVEMEKQASAEKVLGMFWDTASDSFMFSTKFHRIPTQVLKGERAPTKRELLGIVMAVFDPYGLLADFLLFSKILVQESWKYQIDWDDPIPVNMLKKWNTWWNEFQNINTFKISRCYSPSLYMSSDVQLHVFVDASQIAFAAVGYFRIVNGNQTDVAFIAGKTRCAPQKLISVPRLELQAAVLGARLSKIICQKHDVDVSKVVFWSDSRTVLHWIYSTQRKFKPFVSHRISAILGISKPSQWRWVPTHYNSADCATRASLSPKYYSESKWIAGPDFLKLPEKELFFAAIASPPDILEEEVKPCLILQPKASNLILQFNKFSSYFKLTRTMAWVQRATKIFLCRERDKRSTIRGPLTVTELNKAEEFICRFVQEAEFTEEIVTLKDKKLLRKGSQLFPLSPYLDENGLLRISGRLDEAQCLPYSARRPIIMPKKHIVSELIIRHYHEKYHHQNSAVTINALRQKFWIPHCKSLLKSFQRKCLKCKFERAKPLPPIMGQLPDDRVTPFVRPFTYTGVDLFGPFNVAVERRREKRWAVIFTCLTVRAAHLELAENLSTDAFLVCLRNFVNRRGNPVRIRSDNGTNFIGAQKELKDSERILDFDRISEEATARNIEWVFNCPANPSSGGCWERLIGIVKRLLQKTLHETAPRVETLRTVLIEAENIINSRPLTEIPLTSQEDEPLTPNHFLLGCVNSTQTPHPVDTKICLRKQWRIAQNLKDRLWKRWTLEYLPQLLCRAKWRENVTPLKIDDLVLVCEPNQPRSLWKKGRVTKVFPAKDGQVRFAEVKTSSGFVRRPATRLAILEVNSESTKDSRGVECGVTL